MQSFQHYFKIDASILHKYQDPSILTEFVTQDSENRENRFSIVTTEIPTRSLANFHCQKVDRHVDL